ncbi:hypothetical protein HPP92_006932 [Vanilla planifolia]|uniref:Uncharacterized protein n=1 Tax=Vanilla planifolia TaxID=51239 RepID=A0A835R981_VANPL|nr:hypothetical protein HPP92_006932 [Vanilla planifolia]
MIPLPENSTKQIAKRVNGSQALACSGAAAEGETVEVAEEEEEETVGAKAESGSTESGLGGLGLEGMVGRDPSGEATVPGVGNAGIMSGGREGSSAGRMDGAAEMKEVAGGGDVPAVRRGRRRNTAAAAAAAGAMGGC